MNKSRMTNAERRMYFRHKRKLHRIEQRAAKRKNKVSGQFMNRVVICMQHENEPDDINADNNEEVQG